MLRLSAPIVALAIVAVSCDERSGDREGDIDVVTANSELRLAATFHRKVAEAGTWHLLVHERGALSVPDAAYRFCGYEPGTHVILSGTGNPDHLQENIASFGRPELPAADVARLKHVFRNVDSTTGQ